MPGRDDDSRLPHTDGRTRTARIAALNDALRRHRTGGRLLITAGVIALGRGALSLILAQLASFDRFDEDNDPYSEHDFGAFDHAGARLMWKVDYFDAAMRGGSPDPADPAVTTRVLTLMLAEEY